MPIWAWVLSGCAVLGVLPCILLPLFATVGKAVIPEPAPVVAVTWDDLGTNQTPARGRIRNVSSAPLPKTVIEFWDEDQKSNYGLHNDTALIDLAPGEEKNFQVEPYPVQAGRHGFPVMMYIHRNDVDAKYPFRQSYQGRDVVGYLDK